MLITRLFSIVLTLLVFMSLAGQEGAFALTHKLITEGGPYVCKGKGVQKFQASLSVPADFQGDQTWLTFYNGYGGRPGYSWVRVFLRAPGEAGETGEVLADERTFLNRHATSVDVSGRISGQASTLLIEGAGPAGADFSWVLTGSGSALSVMNTTTISPGKSFLIHGSGFGTRKDDVQVTVGGKKAQVVSTNGRIIEAIPPSDLSGKADLSVRVGEKTSNSIRVTINLVPPHLLSMSPYGAPAGCILTIRGANFSRLANHNVVMIGPYPATVFKVLDSGTLLCYVPDWGVSSGTLPVTVTTNGVRSDNSLSFWCVEHIYGGDPDAAGYAND